MENSEISRVQEFLKTPITLHEEEKDSGGGEFSCRSPRISLLKALVLSENERFDALVESMKNGASFDAIALLLTLTRHREEDLYLKLIDAGMTLQELSEFQPRIKLRPEETKR